MRDTILQGMGILQASPPVLHSILIIQKNPISSNSGRHIFNHEEVVIDLVTHFAGVATVTSMLPEEFSVREQLIRAQAATVIVTPPGGGSFITLFAQPGAAVVFVDVMHDGRSQRYPQLAGLGLEDATWTHLGSMEKLHYPICAGESDSGYAEGNIVVQPIRMRHFVYLAMKRAEQNFPSISVRDTRRDNMAKFLKPDMCSMTDENEEMWRIDEPSNN